MKRLVLICLTVFSLIIVSCKGDHKEHNEEHKEIAMKDSYQCPMDCEKGKTYEAEGQCPVCKMNLKKVEVKAENHKHSDTDVEHKESHDKKEDHEHKH